MTDTAPKNEPEKATFSYDGDVAAALAHFAEENRAVETVLNSLSQHEQSFVSARKEVLDKIRKTRRKQSWRLKKGMMWLRWLGMQRILVELRIALTNVIAAILFLVGWIIMVATFLALFALVIYAVIKMIEALVNG